MEQRTSRSRPSRRAAKRPQGAPSRSGTQGIWLSSAPLGRSSAASRPIDAERLDIVPPGEWGRAGSTRTFLRSLTWGLAPLLFGAVADVVAGCVPAQAAIGTHTHGAI